MPIEVMMGGIFAMFIIVGAISGVLDPKRQGKSKEGRCSS